MFSRYYKIVYEIVDKRKPPSSDRSLFEAKGCRSGKAAFEQLKETFSLTPEKWDKLIIDYIQRVY